ncbi:ATP-binding protein [uncultured Desulfovibrio sp.]|uniref:ATP-binding protein n=1 Tax=uncultured Desulfovibrio sp. TaxID=167968 RepID=UPI00267204AB|nr:ATP-binding protein [uncultured Desulfovibrio sp.]
MDLSWMLEEYDGIVYVSDMDSHELLYVNKTGRELFRVDEAALSRRPRCYEVLQGRDAPCPFCTGTRLNESGFYEWEFYNPRLQRTLLLKDRKVRWNGRNARIEFATDISGYRRAIAGHERQRDSILQSLPGGIVRVDARDGRTVLWHGAHFLEMIGYTAEEFAQELHNKCLYVHPDDLTKITALMGRLQESGGTEITEMRIVTREGGVRTLTTTLSYGDAASSPDGIPSFYSVGIDITEIKARQELQQKALEDACRAARAADRAKTDFLSRMSHDIRTPLNAILGMADIAGTRLNDPRGAGECLKKIQTSGRHLLNLINEVLDMSKIESGQMRLAAEEMELAELVRNVLDVCGSLVKEKGHTLAVRADVAHERVRGDFGRLQQLFTNLLANAAKYTPAGGSISFSIDELPSLYTDVGLFECVIEDNGIGMSEDFVKHLFEPFKRADDPRICKVQGTGLGLVISRSIVRLMGGGIKVESRPEEGSRFIVSLPLRLAKETAAAAGAACEQAVLVLAADQEQNLRACRLLEDLGLRAVPAHSAAEARERISAERARSENVAAVLLDQCLADEDEAASPRALRTLCGEEQSLRVILVREALSTDGDSLRDGVDAFLDRPLFRSTLRRALLPGDAEGVESALSASSASLDGKRILLAEDNEINREIVVGLLEMKGASVDAAEDGQRALEMFCASAPDTYDLILMDIQMPRLNGYEAAAAIRARDRADARRVPILALTADAFPEDALLARRYGMNEHISKPVAAEQLYQAVGRWLL